MWVQVSDQVGWVLEERAIGLGLPTEVVADAAMAIGAGIGQGAPGPITSVHLAIGRLVDKGLCDADIAAATHYAPGYVARIRRGLGKAANRRYVA